MTHLTQENFDAEVLQSKQVVLVDFWAVWCEPCKMLEPHIVALATEMPNVKFAKLDVDAQSEIAQRYGVMSMPTLLMFKDGKVMDQTVGVQPKEVIKSKLASLVS